MAAAPTEASSAARTTAGPGSDSAADVASGQDVVLPGGFVQRVLPAGSGQETRWVLMTAALVILFCAAVVAWQHQWQSAGGLHAHQLDLAADLDAREQGVYTDLQVVHDEWVSAGQRLPPPRPDQWAADGWPPFAADLSQRQRGARIWHLLMLGGHHAYLGIPSADGAGGEGAAAPATDPSASRRLMLWRLPENRHPGVDTSSSTSRHDQPPFDVWLRDGEDAPPGEAPLSERLDDADLIAHGWRQVVVRPGQGSGN